MKTESVIQIALAIHIISIMTYKNNKILDTYLNKTWN